MREIDRLDDNIEYALGEIMNIQSELEQYFGGDRNPIHRLEGVEARLGEIADAVRVMADNPGSPFFGASLARVILDPAA